MDVDVRQFLRDSQDWLEAMHARDRTKALGKLAAGQPLTEYERGLIPDEIAAARRAEAAAEAQRKAAETERARELAAAAASVKQVRDVLVAKHIVYRDARVERMAERTVSLALQFGIRIKSAGVGGERANADRRTAYVETITNGERFAGALHEMAHAVDPESDGRQRRNVRLLKSLAAPAAEVAAWRQAIQWAGDLWVKSCFVELVRSLDTYLPHALEPERVEMRKCVREAAAAVVDGPVDETTIREVTARFEERGPLVPWVR